MNKAEIVKNWKSELKSLGLVYKGGLFRSVASPTAVVQFGVSIQKDIHSQRYKINPSILLNNPFTNHLKPRVIVLANLRADGIRLHVTDQSWWLPDDLPRALVALKQFGSTWFESWSRADFLLEKVETSISEQKTLFDVFEPSSADQRIAVSAIWPRELPKRVPPDCFYFASILHFLLGDRKQAIIRTKDWIDTLLPSEIETKKNALIQLAAIE